MRSKLLGIILALFIAPAAAQQTPGQLVQTIASGLPANNANAINALALQNVLQTMNLSYCNVLFCQFSGPLKTYPSTAAHSGVNIGIGVAPTSSVPGDFWETTSGLYANVNGTVGQLISTLQLGAGVQQALANPAGSGGGFIPLYANVAALKASTITIANLTVKTQGYSTPGDGGDAFYLTSLSTCSLNAGAGDGGSQIAPTTGGGCFLAQFPPDGADIRAWGCQPGGQDVIPCMAAANAVGLETAFPSGVFEVKSATTFALPPRFHGQAAAEYNGAAACPSSSTAQGTWLHRGSAYTGITPFTLTATATTELGGFKNVAFCEDHPNPGGGWAPTAYNPWFNVQGTGGELLFDSIYPYAVNKFMIVQSPGTNGRITFQHVRGQTFTYFVSMDNVQDVVHLQDFHLWPYWSNNSNVVSWQQANTIQFLLYRVDGFHANDIFVNNAKSAVQFNSSSNGVATGISFNGSFYCDLCKLPLDVEASNVQVAVNDAHLNSGAIAGSNGVYVGGTASGVQVQIGLMVCGSMGGSCANIASSGTSNTVSINDGRFYNYNQDNNGSAIFSATTGNYVKVSNTPTIYGSNNGGSVIDTSAGGFYEVPWKTAFTPTLFGSGTVGTPTYIVQTGWWQLMPGGQLEADFQVAVSGITGSPTGNATIGGFPYSWLTPSGINPGQCSAAYASATYDAGYTITTAVANAGAKTLTLNESGSSGTQNNSIGHATSLNVLMHCAGRVF